MSSLFRFVLPGLSLLLSAHAADIKVACVGNSITAGYGLAWHEDYPTKLDSILGDGWATTNYGNSGKTMVRGSDDSYWKQPQLPAALAAVPDVVVIELGTNDSKSYIWPAYGKNFKADYRAMIDTFRVLASKPSVWITLQPRANNLSWDMPDTTIARQVNPLIRQVALEAAVNLIDLRAGFAGHPEWYLDDSVHPNALGAIRMAALIAERLKHDRPVVAARGVRGPSVETSADGWGVQWYRNDSLLAGETGEDLKSTLPGVYKASVKIYQNSEDRIVSAPFTWAGSTSVVPRTASGFHVRVDASGRLQVRGIDGAAVDGIRLHDARGTELQSGFVRSGVYTWTLGNARGRIAVP